jgi:hypothetical protein
LHPLIGLRERADVITPIRFRPLLESERITLNWLSTSATLSKRSWTLAGNARKALLVLLGSVGRVLLIVCVNVTNLLLVRGTNLRREFALRPLWGLRARV